MNPVKLSVAANIVGIACLSASLWLRYFLDLDGASALMLAIALPLLLAAVVLAINGK
jgi:Flp pilus assembly protein TadG